MYPTPHTVVMIFSSRVSSFILPRKAADMYHNCIVGLIKLFVPHTFKDFICAEHTARIGCQQIQNVKLNGRELDALAVTDDLMGNFIDLQSFSE